MNEIAFPIEGRLARVALRATEELRQASARAAREERVGEAAIAGTEEPEHVPDASGENGVAAAPPEAAARRAAPAGAAVPRKRPSRAKKAPAAEATANGVTHEQVSTPAERSAALEAEPELHAETASPAGQVATGRRRRRRVGGRRVGGRRVGGRRVGGRRFGGRRFGGGRGRVLRRRVGGPGARGSGSPRKRSPRKRSPALRSRPSRRATLWRRP